MRVARAAVYLAVIALAEAPVSAADFTEREVSVGSAPWKLPGTLTIPAKGQRPFPAVVLIHGSGPQDRDETMGPNKPFQAFAQGLAARGVAVLRYDKRTFTYREKLAVTAELTPKEEVLDDALAAIELLRSQPEINRDRVFVVGHSMGATLAPRLAKMAPNLAGVVLLAGSARPLPDVLAEQTAFLATQPENQSPEAKERIRQIERAIAQLRNLKPDDAGFVLGAPVGYWRWWQQYDPLKEIAKVDPPVLIMQGERDYQVTMADFALWQTALTGRAGVTFRHYPDLNHLFQTGKGRATPAEYMKEGKVSRQFLDDLAAWMRPR